MRRCTAGSPRRVCEPSMRSSWARAAPWNSSSALPASTGPDPATTGSGENAVQPAGQNAARRRLPPPRRASPAPRSSSMPARPWNGAVCSCRAAVTRSDTSVARPEREGAMERSLRWPAVLHSRRPRQVVHRWWVHRGGPPRPGCGMGVMDTPTTLRISRPDDLLGLRGPRGRLGLVARADLADVGDPATGTGLLRDIADLMHEDGARDVFVALYCDLPRDALAADPVVARALTHLRDVTGWADP